MYSANLFLHPGAYTNEDAIPNAINYITRFDDQNIFYYGNWPPNKDSAIALFEDLRLRYPDQSSSQQLQHFWISFKNMSDIHLVNAFAESLAFLFAPVYPICFATHNEASKHLHTHFVVSTTSYISHQPPLIQNIWRTYINTMKQYSQTHYGIYLQEIKKEPSGRS